MILLLLIGLILWGTAGILHAQETPDVLINEIMWAKAEYIELFNTGEDEASLDGWHISRQKPPVSGVDQAEEVLVTFGASDNIPAKGYFLIESAENATEVASNKIKGSLGLLDGGVLLRLHAQDASVADAANRTGSWFAGENNAVGISMERGDASSDGEAADSWHASVGNVGGRVGTPGQANSELVVVTPTPTPTTTPTATPSPTPTVSSAPTILSYSTDIHVNEFLPDPAGDDTTLEFIELFNSGNEEVDISNWALDDVLGAGSALFTIPDGTVIVQHGFVTLYRTQTKLAMNNDTDHVRLLSPDGIIQDDVVYGDTTSGHSYNRLSDGSYTQSSTITPNSINIITTPSSPTPKPTIDAEEEKEGAISYDFSSKIFINEFLPNPKGADTDSEFIELKSQDTKTIHLLGWTLDDASGGSSPYHFTAEDTIGSGKIIHFLRSKTKIALNNDADSVRLIDPDGKVVSSVSYDQKIVEGQSYNRTQDGSFVWSETLTPSGDNTIYVQEKVSPTPKPKAAKKVATPKKKTSAKTSPSRPATSRVLAAISSTLPWPEQVEEGVVSRSVVSSSQSSTGRQKAFIFFGVTVAFMQGLSGFSHKERIWQK